MIRPFAASVFRTRRRLVAAGLLAAVALTGCGDSPMRAGAAATVGETRITAEELTQLVDVGLSDPAAAEQFGADRPAYQREVLSREINSQLVEEAAQRSGVTVTPGEVDRQYQAIEQSVGGPEQLQTQAAAAGLTLEQVRELSRSRALTMALGGSLTRDVQVPPEQLEQAYQQGIDQYDQVRTAQILLPTLKAARDLLPEARDLDDAEFAELARERSTDETTAQQGGDLGLAPLSAFAQGGLEEYGEQAFAAEVGDTFAVESERGGHVVRVLERRTQTREQVAGELRQAALAQQSQAAVQELVQTTARDLGVSVSPRFGRWDPATLAVVASEDTDLSSPSAPGQAPGEGEVPPAEGEVPPGGGEAPPGEQEPPLLEDPAAEQPTQ